MNVLRACIPLMAVWFLVTGNVATQQPPQKSQQQEEKKPLEPVTGELLSLDTNARTLVIRTTADTEIKFSFSEETAIVGVDKGASGLATVSGAILTVTYQEHGTANVATKIEVKAKK